MSPDLLRVAVVVPAADAELAGARLLELSPGGLELEERDGHVELAVYVSAEDAGPIQGVFPAATATPVAEGWENAWRAFHHPVVVGRLWIGPPWESPPAGLEPVVIDPGRAFGTGAHPTTRLCVELLARQKRCSLLDVGCGSGVLSIAAFRLGFGPLVAIDNDPVAIDVTRENAAANGVALEAFTLDGTDGALPPADLAVANVLLEPVTTILQRLQAARAITSGYLASERPPAPGWEHADRLERDGWAADLFVRIRSR
ncbi:MAG: 50S ribosomal protein L11 methyltransferase [Gaiellales bacterium]